MRVPLPWRLVSISVAGVAKSSTSSLRSSSSGRVVSIKSTTSLPPCSSMLMPTLGSDKLTTTCASPCAPRRKSMPLIRAPVAVPGMVTCAFATPPDLVATGVATTVALRSAVMSLGMPSKVSVTSLPAVSILYGTSCTRLTTMRVRPSASTAVTLSTLPTPMVCDLFFTASEVPGKSSATRAGLLIVKFNGSAVSGCDRCSLICTRSPGRELYLMSSTVPPKALTVNHASAASRLPWSWRRELLSRIDRGSLMVVSACSCRHPNRITRILDYPFKASCFLRQKAPGPLGAPPTVHRDCARPRAHRFCLPE